jgi:radical SAM superfamily enzyme YgiQ (UPF0313 family)
VKILLVRPARIEQAITLGEFMFSEPIGLEMVYAVLAPWHQVEIFDMMADKMPLSVKLDEYQPDVVGVTSLCIDVNAVLDIAVQVKKYHKQVVTVVGGTQAFLRPASFFSASVDYIFRFTTRQNLTDFFAWLEQYCDVKNGGQMPEIGGVCAQADGFAGLDARGRNEYILPDRKSTSKYRNAYSYFGYRPSALLGTARGCSKKCNFCLRWRIEGGAEEYLPMELVREDLLNAPEPTVMIYDNDFLHHVPRLEEFCRMLEEAGIKKNFICYASVESVLAAVGTLQRFRKLGLQAVLLGYETYSDAELASYGKKSTRKDNLAAAAILREAGVDVWASLMLHPAWNREDFKELRRHLRQLRPQITSMCPLTPFPNLPLFQQYQDNLLVADDDYEKWSFAQLTIRPSALSTRQYYREMLITNFYINLYMNNLPYVIRKFGFASVWRLAKGSVKVFWRYVKLMRAS